MVRPRFEGEDVEFQEPLGAEAICGYLREHQVEARVFDRRLGTGIHEIEAYGPDWIGFSLMTDADAPDALRMQQMLAREGRRFFAGGLFVTTCPERAGALFPAGTVLISGEGEGPALELVTTGKVQGVLKPGPDEWAFASRDRLREYLDRGGVINIRTSRGCKGSCAFCTTPGEGIPGRHETRSIGRVADEMARLVREGYPPIFNFTDDMFGDDTRIAALADALKQRSVRAAFSLEMRAYEVSRTPPDAWPALHAGGLCRVFTGMESLDPGTLRAWHKPVDLPRLTEAVKAMGRCGIACETGYILWHDRTEPESARAEAEKLSELELLSPKTALSRLVIFPGSELHRKGHREGMYLCPLRPEAEALYAEWEEVLSRLTPLWSAASCALPKSACEAFLREEASEPLRRLEACLRRIRHLTGEALAAGRAPAEKDCEEIRGELLALHVAGAGRL